MTHSNPAIRTTRLILMAVALFTTADTSEAQESPATAKLDALVSQLADPEYQAREAATRTLVAVGPASEPAVRNALRTNGNPEVQRRCLRILARIAYNRCLDRGRKFLGDAPAVNAYFRELYITETALWTALATDSPELPALYMARCADLANGPPRVNRAVVRAGWGDRYMPTEEALATLLLVGAEYRDRLPRPALDDATKVFTRVWGRRYARDTPPLLRATYVTWAERIGGLPVEYVGDKKLDAARQALRAADTPASERQYALLALAKANDRSDDALIRDRLQDDIVCDILFVKGTKREVRLRDVALAAVIHRAGKDPRDFGFDALSADPTYLFAPSTLGFPSAAARTAAFQKWREASEK